MFKTPPTFFNLFLTFFFNLFLKPFEQQNFSLIGGNSLQKNSSVIESQETYFLAPFIFCGTKEKERKQKEKKRRKKYDKKERKKDIRERDRERARERERES